jgi:capsular polysaccharide biosynthesis protein
MMDDRERPSATGLPPLRSLRRHLVLLLAATFLGALVFGGAASQLATRYQSTASVLLRPLPGNPYSPDAQGSDLTNLETESQLVTSTDVVRAVGEALGDRLEAPIRLPSVVVSVAPNTQIVRISYTDPSPEVAAQVSDQFAQSYLEFRQERRNAKIDQQVEGLTTRIDAVQQQLEKLRKQGRSEDDAEVKSLGGQLLNLRLQLTTAKAAETQAGEVIAQSPARRSGIAIPPWAATLVGAVLGLALGVAVALVRERSSTTVRTLDDLESLGVTVLGHESPDGDQAPSDSALMAGAVVNRRVPRPATITISHLSGPSPDHEFAEDLAHAVSLGADGVLVVDSDPWHLRPKSRGLSDVLRGRPLARLVTKDPRGFMFLGPGRALEEVDRWFATKEFSAVLEEGGEEFGLVLVHGDGADTTQGRALVGVCDFWIPLVVLGKTSRTDLERAMAWAATVGTRILGVVAFDPSRQPRRTSPDATILSDE